MNKTEIAIIDLLLRGHSFPLKGAKDARIGLRIWSELPNSTSIFKRPNGAIYLMNGNYGQPLKGQLALANELIGKYNLEAI